MTWLTFWLIDSVDEMQRPNYRKNERRKWSILAALLLVLLGVIAAKGLP